MEDEVYYSRHSQGWSKNIRFLFIFLVFACSFYAFNHYVLRVYRLKDFYCREIPAGSYVFATFYYPFWGIVPKTDDLVFVDVLGHSGFSLFDLAELLSLGVFKAESLEESSVVSQRLYRIIAIPGDTVYVKDQVHLCIKASKSSQVKVYRLPDYSPPLFSLLYQREFVLPHGEYLAYLSGADSLAAAHTFCLLKLRDILAQARFFF